MYKDMSAKLAFHKEKIIQSFIDKGIYPTDERVQNLINSIDLGLPYLVAQEVKPGEEFDCEIYNAMVNSIYKDLELLYRILNELSIKEYVMLKSFIDTHLDSLENKVNFYKEKATQEVNSTSLGKTILFKNSNYNITTNNTIQTIKLGNILVHKASRISCYLNANEIEADKAVFVLTGPDNKQINVTPYNYNQNSIVIPGNMNIKEYDYTIDDKQVISSMTKMDLNTELNPTNKYEILGGKDKILVKQFGELTNQQFINKPTSYDMLGFSEKSYIDFYTVGTKSITFRFNKKPINTNFSLDNYKVDNLNYIHHFFIECDAGFAFDFEIDGGQVYAIRSSGLILDNELYFPKTADIREFHIIEYEIGDPIIYDCQLRIINDDAEPINIDSIMIKELLPMEDTNL